jgi:MFS family permease
MLLASLGSSIANIALPTLIQAFRASFQQAQWIVLAYLLSITALIVSAGRLGDLIGRRRLLLGGILLFTAGSASSALAPTLAMLVAARAVQGLGAAVMMALTMAFVAGTVPKERTGRAMGLLASMSSVGTALGPTLGGVLIGVAGWPAIFLVHVPLGLLAWLLARRFLPADPPATTTALAGFDVMGTVLLALTLVAYALATTLGQGRFGVPNMALLAAAALGVALFIRSQARTPAPLIRLETFRQPGLSAGFAMSILVMTVLMAMLVVGPFHLSHALALSPAQVGVAMSAGPLIAALAGVPAGRAVDRFGPARMTVAGLVTVGLGCVAVSAMPGHLGVSGFICPMMAIAAGYALFQSANNTAVMREVSSDRRGVVSGMLGLSRSLGSITGAAAMGAVFAARAASAGGGPEGVGAGVRFTFGVAAGLVLIALAIAVVAGRQRTSPGQ